MSFYVALKTSTSDNITFTRNAANAAKTGHESSDQWVQKARVTRSFKSAGYSSGSVMLRDIAESFLIKGCLLFHQQKESDVKTFELNYFSTKQSTTLRIR